MRNILFYLIVAFGLFVCILISCDKDDDLPLNTDFKILHGTWIDESSDVLSFIDFFSETQARFGTYNHNTEKHEVFNYNIIGNELLIDFVEGNQDNATKHILTYIDSATIEISDLTDIPENPDKRYIKTKINTEKINDTIVIGLNEVFYDFELDYQIKLDSVINDSRCPEGAMCFWEGNAEIRFEFINNGNRKHEFNLNTYSGFQSDSIIEGIRFYLIGLTPGPSIHEELIYSDYKAKLIVK